MIINHPDELKQGLRIIMRITRNKEGGIGNVDRKSTKIITNGSEEFDFMVKALSACMDKEERVYATADARSIIKASKEFKRRQLDADYDQNPCDFYLDIWNRWISCLQNKDSRDGKSFLFDCDTQHEYDYFKSVVPSDALIHEYATKQGHHIISKPFNTMSIRDDMRKHIKTNAMILCAFNGEK